MLLRTLDILTGDIEAFAGWLRTFDDPARANAVARRSYWHPNGFAKLVLKSGTDHKVRLHVWPAGSHRLGESNPHGHRWNFASTVLSGDGLEDTHYRESDTGLPYESYRYAGGNAADAVTRRGTVHLDESGRFTRANGVAYTLDTSVVHTVRPLGSALIATLVIQGPALHDDTPVYGAPGVNVDEPGHAISGAEVHELIRDVLAALAPQAR
jgi:hypothetical protein